MKHRCYESYASFEKEKEKCRACPVGKVYDEVVLSDGNKQNPKLIIIGEAPGREEIEEGKPFVGKSGKLLRNTMHKHGITTNNTLITNTIPCRPEKNKFPSDGAMVYRCRNAWLAEELRILKPNAILLVGSRPLLYTMGLKGITKLRGEVFHMKLKSNGHKVVVLSTFHPSFVLRKQHMKNGDEIMRNFANDIQKASELAKIR